MSFLCLPFLQRLLLFSKRSLASEHQSLVPNLILEAIEERDDIENSVIFSSSLKALYLSYYQSSLLRAECGDDMGCKDAGSCPVFVVGCVGL